MTRFLDWLLDPLRFRRKPKDRWPVWRPDQILTPENRSMTGLTSYGNPSREVGERILYQGTMPRGIQVTWGGVTREYNPETRMWHDQTGGCGE